MANNEKKSLTKEDIDRLLEKIPSSGFAANSASVFKSGVSKLLEGSGSNPNNDLSSTSEWAKVNNATVSTGPSSGASSATSSSVSSSSSSAPTIGAAEASLYKLDDQQKDLDKRRSVLRQSYAQGKYDLSTKEGRDNYRRDTMFTGFGTWKGQKSPMALLRRADRELKRGNKAQAQHWLDMHDELYGNKTRDKRMALNLEALDEEQKRLDKRREEATRNMFAQKDEDLANKKLALQKEAADREEKYQEWARDFRLAEFGKDQRQFAARLNASRAQDQADREERKAQSDAKAKASQEEANKKAQEAADKAYQESLSSNESSTRHERDRLISLAKLKKEADEARNEELSKLTADQISSTMSRIDALEKQRKSIIDSANFERAIRGLPEEEKAKRRDAFYGKMNQRQNDSSKSPSTEQAQAPKSDGQARRSALKNMEAKRVASAQKAQQQNNQQKKKEQEEKK